MPKSGRGIDHAREAARLSGFAQHGWAMASLGVKLLWLPVVAEFCVKPPKKVLYGGGSPALVGSIQSIQATCHVFEETLRKLALTLAYLHRLRTDFETIWDRTLKEPSGPWNEDDSALIEFEQQIALHVDLAFVYLRRIADRFADAARFVLFEHPQSAPRTFKKLRALAEDASRLRMLAPIYDEQGLVAALLHQCGWFDLVRGAPETSDVHGIRDRLEHHATHIWLRPGEAEAAPLQALLAGERSLAETDLLGVLPVAIGGLCQFWTKVCAAVATRTCYEERDHLFVAARFDDIAAFWPEISAAGAAGE